MHRWKLSTLATATFVTTALTSLGASALTLGAMRVDSALGENLRAEIALPQATPAELSSLVSQIATPEAFRTHGLDYSAASSAIIVQLVRKPDGSAALQLRSNTPLSDPFIDLLVDARWNAGNLLRSYTLLLDPPALKRSAGEITVSPQVPVQITSAPTPTPARAAAPASMPAPAPTVASTPEPASTVPAAPVAASVAPATPSTAGKTYSSSPRPQPAAAPRPAPSVTPTASSASETASIQVRTGDTAGRIARTHRPSGVSLDQMLIAMLRSNPDAFIDGNVNLVRAGAVLQMPSREQALETSAQAARQLVAAQSRDFNTYRRSLATKAPQAAVQAATRATAGQVQAHVSETRPSAESPDKLTLSKATVQDAAAEEQLAIQKQAQAQESRLSELQRNLAELNELAQGGSATPPAAATPAIAAAGTDPTPAAAAAAPADTPTPALEIAGSAPIPAAAETAQSPSHNLSEETADTAVSTPGSTATPGEAAPSPSTSSAPPAATPAPSTASSSLLDDPIVPAGAGLVAILLGLLGYSVWKRRRAARTAAQDPSLGDSQLHPDTFFAGSGGQHVDTTDATATTMAYAPSQLDGDVDLVAEADVYLAYGRDEQAEEILKDALRTQPERTAIYTKLADIYAKRNDAFALEKTARALQPLCSPQSPEWQQVAALGRQVSPDNPLFTAPASSSAAAPTSAQPTTSFAAALQASAASAASATAPAEPTAPAPADASAPASLDFPLELPDPAAPVLNFNDPVPPTEPPTLVQDTVIDSHPESTSSGLDLDLSGFEASLPTPPATAANAQPAAIAREDSLNIDLDAEPAAPTPAAPSEAPPAADPGFDLNGLNLDLTPPETPAEAPKPMHNLADDPLATKLDLAREFNAIGDSEGARSLIEEVLAEASGPLKERAQKMLSELD